jgi:RES domain-containing protein
MIVYRVVHARWKDDIWSGMDAWKHDGRWHTRGHRVVYASDSLALATLETLVNLRKTRRLKGYYKSWAKIPDQLIQTLPRNKLPIDWQIPIPPDSTKKLGDTWLEKNAGLALKVPSAASPSEWDVLMNPEHPDFKKIRVMGTELHVVDPRLIKK